MVALRPGAAWVAAFAATLGGCSGGAPPAPARNLVVVVLDTVRADHLGLYGYARATTPHLDRFATSGVVFENAQSSAPWTAPALISLVTSLYPAVHGVQAFPLPPRAAEGATTLAQVLADAGAATAAFTEGGYAKGDFGLDRGFDVFPAQPGDADSHLSNLHAPSRTEGNLQRALEWLGARDERPFFLLVHSYEAHVPYRAPLEYIRRFRPGYDPEAEHERLREAIEAWNRRGEWSREDALLYSQHEWHCLHEGLPEIERAEEQAEHRRSFAPLSGVEQLETAALLIDLYDAEIRYLDECYARLWSALEAGGHMDDTVVVVVSDHGEGFGEHGRFAHGTVLHEELLRIALVVRAPGLSGRRIETVVRSIDVMPTALELLGRDVPTGLQGESLVQWMRGDAPAPDLPSFSHGLTLPGAEDALESVRRGRWRLIATKDGEQVALYDLERDPEELHDVAAQHPEVTRELRERLREQRRLDGALRQRIGEPSPLPAPGAEARRELEALGYSEEG